MLKLRIYLAGKNGKKAWYKLPISDELDSLSGKHICYKLDYINLLGESYKVDLNEINLTKEEINRMWFNLYEDYYTTITDDIVKEFKRSLNNIKDFI